MPRRKQRLKLVPSQPSFISHVESDSKHKVHVHDLKPIYPLTQNQELFFNWYQRDFTAMFLHGVAGTGKTYIALYNAFKEILEKVSPYKRVILVRSAVPSRDIGHLPGDEKEKTEVYLQPYKEILRDLFPRFGDMAFLKLREQALLDFTTTSFVRGITFDHSIIIVDECQSMTYHELDSVITRCGERSKIIFCGDYRQNDLIYRKNDRSGIKDFMNVLQNMSKCFFLEFHNEDIVRSGLVKEYIIHKTEYFADRAGASC